MSPTPLPPPPPPPARAISATKLSVFGTPWPLAPELLRVRLKYITVRFLQMPEPRVLLRNGQDILRWAQQMEDDNMPRSANELVRLAVEEDPSQRVLWLYLLSHAVIEGDTNEFGELTRLFSQQFVDDGVLEDIAHVGGVLARDVSQARVMPALQSWSAAALLARDSRTQRAFHDALQREIGVTQSSQT
jgi:hypothetical protein